MNVHDQNKRPSGLTPPPRADAATRPRILFVDDEVPIVLGLKRSLRHDFEVEAALGAKQAFELMEQSGGFAVIVSDMRMPDMDGATFLGEVRRRFPATIRIMLTGDQTAETPQEAINKGGVFRLLRKPCCDEEMREVLIDALKEHYRAKDQSKRAETLLQSFKSDANSPLQTILGYSDYLEQEAGQPDYVRAYCASIRENVQTLSGQANRLLTFMMLHEGKWSFDPIALDIQALLCGLYSPLQHAFSAKQGGIDFRVHGDCEHVPLDQCLAKAALSILLETALLQMSEAAQLQLYIWPSTKETGKICFRLSNLSAQPEGAMMPLVLDPLEQRLLEHICGQHGGVLEPVEQLPPSVLFSMHL